MGSSALVANRIEGCKINEMVQSTPQAYSTIKQKYFIIKFNSINSSSNVKRIVTYTTFFVSCLFFSRVF